MIMKDNLALSNGAVHADLMGSSSAYRFRPRRLSTKSLNFDVHCEFTFEGREVGPLPVVDISPTGVATHPPDAFVIAPGTKISDLKLVYRNAAVWEGEAVCVYQVDGPPARVGLKFSSRLLDLHLLAISDSVVEHELERELELHEQSLERLPDSWRAAVAAFRRLLEGAKDLLSKAERELDSSAPSFGKDQMAIFERVFSKWAPSYYSLQGELSELSSHLSDGDQELAQSYAAAEILPLFYPSPMYRRAHEKPFGYAGDFELMRMYFGSDYAGDSFYARFLQHLAQRYPLGQTVQARERTLRKRILSILARNQETKIVSLACGPAIEIQNALKESGPLRKRVEFVLVDQDEHTMHYCHDALSRAVVQRTQDPRTMVELNCINISIKQILQPSTDVEAKFIVRSLKGADFIYATGLFDYLPQPIALRLLRRLYGLLEPGGTVFIGNLRHCPVSTWIMEYVLAWHLQYRTEETMLSLCTGLAPDPVLKRTVTDDTGLCIFLEIAKPELEATGDTLA